MKKTWIYGVPGSLAVWFLLTGWLPAGLPSRFHDVALVGDGAGLRTVILLLSQQDDDVTVEIKFFSDGGTPLQVNLEGEVDSTFEITLEAGGTKKLTTPGTAQQLQTGWARIEAGEEIAVQVFFEIAVGGVLVTQAAVEPSGPITTSELFVLQQPNSRTGVSIANLSDVNPITVRLILVDESGAVADSKDIVLEALHKIAQFIDELFPGIESFQGKLKISTSGPTTIVTLQQTGLVLGTLPPVEIF